MHFIIFGVVAILMFFTWIQHISNHSRRFAHISNIRHGIHIARKLTDERSSSRPSVVKTKASSSVYILNNNTLHLIPDWDTFLYFGYSWQDIRIISDGELSIYSFGKQVEIEHGWWESTSWLVNFPKTFFAFQNRSVHAFDWAHKSSSIDTSLIPGNLIDVRLDSEKIKRFEQFTRQVMPTVDIYTDGESIDAIEHFFWGMENGIAIELGALDGSPYTHSQTYAHEAILGWNRILIEANPEHRANMKSRSPGALGIISAICNTQSIVHYAKGIGSPYTGGILEYMSPDYMKGWHSDLYNACESKGNVSTLDFSKINKDRLIPVDCMPLHHLFHKIQIKHVNLFILDVEGAELDILRSIDWTAIVFDVLAIETEDRAIGYNNSVASYLGKYGYIPTIQMFRNTWFVHKDFIPSKRPGLDSHCYNGVNHALYNGRWMSADGKIEAFVPCKLEGNLVY